MWRRKRVYSAIPPPLIFPFPPHPQQANWPSSSPFSLALKSGPTQPPELMTVSCSPTVKLSLANDGGNSRNNAGDNTSFRPRRARKRAIATTIVWPLLPPPLCSGLGLFPLLFFFSSGVGQRWHTGSGQMMMTVVAATPASARSKTWGRGPTRWSLTSLLRARDEL